ncbi:F-box protein [Arabidopsis thaliana]
MDRVGSLPDELLSHILSFLTTKEAALTSLLSKRWRYLIAFVPNLAFDDIVFLHPEEGKPERDEIRQSFMDFVDRVLALQAESPIKKFSLKCRTGVDSDRVDGWISNVLNRGVSELDLLIILGMTMEDSYRLSPKGFASKTLVKLEIGCGIDISWRVRLPINDGLEDAMDNVVLRFGHVGKLMNGIRNVEYLELSADTLEVLSLCCESMPVFKNLKSLAIKSTEGRGWQAMPVLLRNCPHLEFLLIEGLLHHVTDKCGDACDCVPWEDKGRSLTSCPVNMLEIHGFRGTKKEMQMIKHFLDYFPSLKEMDIYADEDGPTNLEAPGMFEQITQLFTLYDEFYTCDVQFMVRGSLYKKLTAQCCVFKEENLPHRLVRTLG